ncbi:MAG: DegT/DnrJ/EryC1/StrS family aminotransferase [Deltaproteobacteria bacterium]|nr:DegT/DnrJ/EryC1/StrS family aminotransferase [Deltaproteobacteria bacterium]
MTRPRVPDRRAFAAELDAVLAARWFTNDGALVRRLERLLRERLGVGFCAAFCNGTVALQVALRSLALRGEVITTPFTFPATVHAIEWNGLTPVFCDVDPDTYNLDPQRAAELITPQTSALLPVHVFGNPCDVLAIERLAAQRGLRVVYDAAHAFGVSHQGRPIGHWGDLSVLSFHATKLFHTAEGGAVVGADAERAGAIALLRNFGIVNEDEVRGVGLNGKLSELHAALGLSLFGLIDEEIAARGRLVARYRAGLAGVPGLRQQRGAPATEPNHAYFSVEVEPSEFGLTRDELHAALRAEQVIARKYFHPLCSDNDAYRHLPSARPCVLPNATRLATRILCLPLYGELAAADVDAIVDAIRALHASAPRVRAALRAGS